MVYIWFIVCGAALILYYLYRKVRYSLWFAIGGFGAWLLALLNINILLQLGSFLLIAIFTALIDLIPGNKKPEPAPKKVEGIILQPGIVTETIGKNFAGKVKVQGNEWIAYDADLKGIMQGEYIKVVNMNGNKVLVERTNQDNSKSRYERHFRKGKK